MRAFVVAVALGLYASTFAPAVADDGYWRYGPSPPTAPRPYYPPPPAAGYVPPAPVAAVPDVRDIADIQTQLTARGYYGGPIDGRIDDYVRTAISVYQRDVRLAVTGEPDKATQNMLHFGPNVRATIAPIAAPSAVARVAPVEAAPPPSAPSAVPAYAPPPPPPATPRPATSDVLSVAPPTVARLPQPSQEHVLAPPRPEPPIGANEPPKPQAAPQPLVERGPVEEMPVEQGAPPTARAPAPVAELPPLPKPRPIGPHAPSAGLST